MPDFSYPDSAELLLIEQDKMPVLTQDDPTFDLFPIIDRDTSEVIWEQEDIYTGLQQGRGLNGEPARVVAVGTNRFKMEAGAYGEFRHIDEKQLTERRRPGTWNEPVSIDDLVMKAQDQLLNRRIDRLRYNVWTLLTTGVLEVFAANSSLIYRAAYTFQTHTAAVNWATAATATPLADLRAVQLKAAGYSLDFGRGAVGYMNRVTANRLLGVTNVSDIGGKRVASGATFNTLEDYNSIFLDSDLPQLKIYDEGYYTDGKVFTRFIPNDIVVVVGKRPPGQTVGEYQMVRNANNPDMAPGPYTRVFDRGDDKVLRSIEVHDGHNGGLGFFYPTAVCILDTTP